MFLWRQSELQVLSEGASLYAVGSIERETVDVMGERHKTYHYMGDRVPFSIRFKVHTCDAR